MRRVYAVLSSFALALSVVCTAQAAEMDYIGLSNLDNANWTDDVPLRGPTATTGGVYWLDTGSGPTALEQNVNLEFLGSATTSGPYVDLISLGGGARAAHTPALFLLSNPAGTDQSAIGWNVVATYGPRGPGNPNGTNGCQGIMIDPIGDNFGIPGVVHNPGEPSGGGNEFVEIRAWTGNFSTWEAALAGGAYAGKVNFSAFFANGLSFPTDMSGMPALVMRTVLPGDSNLDGTVDVTDLSKVLTNYDKAGMTWAQGDFNNDALVEVTDLSKVLTNYNKTAGSASGLKTVPEPSSLVLVAAGLVGLAASARRKRC